MLVTGATGTTGRNAIKKLLELQIRVRAFVHKTDARSEQLRASGVEIVQGALALNSGPSRFGPVNFSHSEKEALDGTLLALSTRPVRPTRQMFSEGFEREESLLSTIYRALREDI